MTEQEREWFDSLIEDRKESAKTLEKPSMSGVRIGVVEKYSEQAHFIYELLQNANDVEATKATFNLENEGLYFSHNGTINFSISNPNTEDKDKETNLLGHINSITSIANTNKTEFSVGKFGVGFKSVFQYTETPHIYDKNFRFKIERFIVPQLLEKDLEKRQENETTFYFPFDNQQKPATEAYKDILKKLNNLTYPTLFLSYLREVSWKTETEDGKYYKELIKNQQEGNMVYEKYELVQEINNEKKKERIWLFSRQIENRSHSYSIGFFLDEKEKLKPIKLDAFCFFPTRENANLNFIIHAPFLLTDNRGEIKSGQTNNWNEDIIERLAELAADSLPILKKLKLLDDDIINIIPYKQLVPFFSPFYDKIKQKFQTMDILPSIDGTFAKKEEAYWIEYPFIANLYKNEQIANLMQNQNSKIVFSSMSENNVSRGDKDKANYIKSITNDTLKFPDLLDRTNIDFIQKQDINWLAKFYEQIVKSECVEKAKIKPIFIDSNNKAVAAFRLDNDSKKYEQMLFISGEFPDTSYKYILKELYEKSKEFIEENFKIKEPSLRDEIYHHILPLYETTDGIETDVINIHFQKFFKYYKSECPQSEINSFIDLIKDKKFVLCKNESDNKIYRHSANKIYYPSNDLKQYFENKLNTLFLDLEFYCNLVKENEQELLNDFLRKLGVAELPRILSNDITNSNKKNEYSLSRSTLTYSIIEKYIDGCEQILQNLNEKKSNLLWKFLILLFDKYNYLLKGEHQYYYRGATRKEYFESSEIKRLKTTQWLLTKNGKFVSPQELYIDDLSDNYDIENDSAKKLIEFLGIKKRFKLDEFTPDEIKELEREIKERNKPDFPISRTYSLRRVIEIEKKYTNAEPIAFDKKEISYRKFEVDPKTYLKSLYINDDRKLICQICKNEMPFEKKNEEYYFEKVEIFHTSSDEISSQTSILTKESEIAYICCCPICAAKYRPSFKDKLQKNKIKEKILNENIEPNKAGNYEISIPLDETASICFVETHFMDLKTILKVENGSRSTESNSNPAEEIEIQDVVNNGININDKLLLEFIPSDEKIFKQELLKTRRAKRTWYYKDNNIIDEWDASKFTIESNLKGNILSNNKIRAWRETGLIKVKFEILEK